MWRPDGPGSVTRTWSVHEQRGKPASRDFATSGRVFVLCSGLGFLLVRPRLSSCAPHVEPRMEDMEILTVPLTELRRQIRAEEYELGD